MAPFPIYNPFMISSAVMGSSWAIYSIGAATAAIVLIAALGEADPDEQALEDAAAKWREAKGKISELAEKFQNEASPPLESWDETDDRAKFDAVITKVANELASIEKVLEGNATALDEAKKWYNIAMPTIFGIVLAGTIILVSLMALKATIVGAPAVEGVQTGIAWGTVAAILGIIAGILALIMALIAYSDSSSKIKFETEAGKGDRGSDVDFTKIEIDWGTSQEGAKPA
ncbi:WXG100 family type VII secretion target [Tenggerimyces flavus]|uniref:WXG100 family type VII secretion target n=1 Tax=Tenggerimyces flavus TaxID=1708749 RepID=A0ABV7Y4X7_9ACTN|nr:hypothetical protein [Tenggerimyces flavus]MBM7788691.1 hypothetical protein [Tenggerimyces flavus]